MFENEPVYWRTGLRNWSIYERRFHTDNKRRRRDIGIFSRILKHSEWRTRLSIGKLWLSWKASGFPGLVTYVTGFSSHRPKGPLFQFWT